VPKVASDRMISHGGAVCSSQDDDVLVGAGGAEAVWEAMLAAWVEERPNG
jgi:hypothetical protein